MLRNIPRHWNTITCSAKCLNDTQYVAGPCKLALLSFLSRFQEPECSSSHLSYCQHEGLLEELWAAARHPAQGQRLMPGTANTDRAFGACPGQGWPSRHARWSLLQCWQTDTFLLIEDFYCPHSSWRVLVPCRCLVSRLSAIFKI